MINDDFIGLFDRAMGVRMHSRITLDLKEKIELEHIYENLIREMAEMSGGDQERISDTVDGLIKILREENANFC